MRHETRLENEALEYAADNFKPVTESCGCVFCDLGLDPDIVIDGVKFHHVQRRGNILCERKTEPTPMMAFRYSAK